jgi:hypothetical protein
MAAIFKKEYLFLKPKTKTAKILQKNISKDNLTFKLSPLYQADTNTNSTCEEVKLSFSDLNSLIKNNLSQLRFENIHKKIGSHIYRLRHFFKDGDEGEIETFLVYVEDFEENAKIVEKSTYSKGHLFLKIEKSKGDIIYHEEGLNFGENLFLHYIDNQLREAQGQPDGNTDFKNLDCHFQHA